MQPQQSTRVIISMKTNLCTIVLPQNYDRCSPSDFSPTNFSPVQDYSVSSPGKRVFVQETEFKQKEPRDTKALAQSEHRFKKKIPKYDNMITHFSFK